MRRVLAGAVGMAALAGLLAGCDGGSTVSRPGQPLVLTGADLTELVGEAPGDIVAFRHTRPGGTSTWTQVPVQVDERKVVPFGTQPPNNTTPGTTGTVYGNGSGGPTALQYADPGTFVGADTNPAFDADDELVVMVDDAGGQPSAGDETEPAGVVAGSGVAVEVEDPQKVDSAGWIYLFVSDGSLSADAGEDYVDYRFELVSGDYKTTYKRRLGPNPETSSVTTPTYRVGFSDRWIEDSWQITAGTATGVDILDGHKNQFAVNSCVRSNATFAAEEGAFVANIDGPVRAIRSYIGANSGPRTQRTHLMYRDQEVIVTDLRVHSIPAMMDFLDYSTAASGMTYRSSTVPAGVTIDGTNDAVPTTAPAWETVSGPQGTVFTTGSFSFSGPALPSSLFYRDQSSPPEAQCWGDGSFLGASGVWITGTIPNTDPGSTPFATLSGTRVVQFLAPPIDGPTLNAVSQALADDVTTPLSVTVSPYVP